MPIGVLRLPSLAYTPEIPSDRTARHISLVDVLPTEPVTATRRGQLPREYAAESRPRAETVLSARISAMPLFSGIMVSLPASGSLSISAAEAPADAAAARYLCPSVRAPRTAIKRLPSLASLESTQTEETGEPVFPSRIIFPPHIRAICSGVRLFLPSLMSIWVKKCGRVLIAAAVSNAQRGSGTRPGERSAPAYAGSDRG